LLQFGAMHVGDQRVWNTFVCNRKKISNLFYLKVGSYNIFSHSLGTGGSRPHGS
jgi:hypothetical protein